MDRARVATFSKDAFIAKVIIMRLPGHAGHSIESMASRLCLKRYNSMERKIGEKFSFDGDTLEVVETTGNSCKSCYFGKVLWCRFESIINTTGECSALYRNDKKYVKFKEVE